jgi:hypothetical protein
MGQVPRALADTQAVAHGLVEIKLDICDLLLHCVSV